jgi:site-specific recombinase XerD
VTSLRQRFIDDLRLHNLAPRTIEAYVAAIVKLGRFAARSPDQLGPEDIRQFQLDLLDRKVSWSQFNQTVTAMRWLFGVTLQRPEAVPAISFGHRPQRLPVVLATDEVSRLLDAARPGRDRVLLQTTYACGLRLSELLRLAVQDIDSARMFVVVRQGKGRLDRLVPLSPRLLGELRAYWRMYRPQTCLFPGTKSDRPLCDGALQRLMQRTKRAAGIDKPATMHTLRHSFATHLHEAGVDLVTLQKLLGHRSIDSTLVYLHLSQRHLQKTPSLLDLIALPKNPPPTTEGQS